MIKVTEIQKPEEKSSVCNDILRALPDWFGNEAAIVDYVDKVKEMPFIVAYDNDKSIGFIAILVHSEYTAEVCVMGVLEDYHRQGIGEELIKACEQFCQNENKEFLTVKTLDISANYEPYDKTRNFYIKMGFKPLEIFPLLWDKDNPCLYMAKYIGKQN